MKKLLALFLVMMMMSFVVSGCSKSEDETATTQATVSEKTEQSVEEKSLSGQTIVIGRWGGNDAETAAFKKMVQDFEAATGVTVEERVYSDYNTELQAELIGGSGPDVFYVDAYMAPFYIEQGVLLPLDSKTFELDAFYEPLRNAFLRNDQYYAVSKDYSTLALYYNKAYVNPEEVPSTLEELFTGDYLVTLKASLPSNMVAMTYNRDIARNLFMAEAGGASIVKDEIYSNLADQAVIENLRFEYEAAKAGKLFTPADLGTGWNGDAFGNERTAIMIEGNWSLGFLEQNFPNVEFGVMELPTFKGEKGTMVFTVGYAINAKSKSVDAASAFIKYATGVDGMATWTQGAGVLPSREDVTLATDVLNDPLKAPHIAGADYATPWQKGTTMDTINVEFQNYMPSYINGERTLEDALKMAQDEANKTISANN